MTIPDFQKIMLPLLRIAQDERPHRLSELYEELAADFQLSQEDRDQLLPSGRQATFENRVGWARTYLNKAGLLATPSRGICTITPEGLELLKENPPQVNISLLRRYPEFEAYRTRSSSNVVGEPPLQAGDNTPEEDLENAHQRIVAELRDDILEAVKSSPPVFFESLVVELLTSMGYGGSRVDAGRAIGKSGDGGIDGIIKEDRLGLNTIYIQAKRWEGTVGRPVVQAFTGSLEGQRAIKGVLITTSQFSADAVDFVTRIGKKVVLIDGNTLADLMIEHGVGVTTIATYEVKRLDRDYFAGEV